MDQVRDQPAVTHRVVTASYLLVANPKGVVGEGTLNLRERKTLSLDCFRVFDESAPRLMFLDQPLYIVPADIKPCRLCGNGRPVLTKDNLPKEVFVTNVARVFPGGVPDCLKTRGFF